MVVLEAGPGGGLHQGVSRSYIAFDVSEYESE
jgi:hypothetical protein